MGVVHTNQLQTVPTSRLVAFGCSSAVPPGFRLFKNSTVMTSFLSSTSSLQVHYLPLDVDLNGPGDLAITSAFEEVGSRLLSFLPSSLIASLGAT